MQALSAFGDHFAVGTEDGKVEVWKMSRPSTAPAAPAAPVQAAAQSSTNEDDNDVEDDWFDLALVLERSHT